LVFIWYLLSLKTTQNDQISAEVKWHYSAKYRHLSDIAKICKKSRPHFYSRTGHFLNSSETAKYHGFRVFVFCPFWCLSAICPLLLILVVDFCFKLLRCCFFKDMISLKTNQTLYNGNTPQYNDYLAERLDFMSPAFLLSSEPPQFYWGFKKALAMSRKNKPPMLK